MRINLDTQFLTNSKDNSRAIWIIESNIPDISSQVTPSYCGNIISEMTGYLSTLSQADITRLLGDKYNNPPFSQYKLHSFYSRLKSQKPNLAAVLVPFHKEDDEWHILFTRQI